MAIDRKPQNITERDWYYESRTHLLLVHQVYDKQGNYVQTDQFKLPWRMVERSRLRRPKQKSRV